MKRELALELFAVSKGYDLKPECSKVLDNVSLNIESGGLCCVIGPSGSGKTTLLKVSAGLLRPDSGMVRVFGFGLYGVSGDERQRLRRVVSAFMFQEDLLIETLSLKENVELPLIVRGAPRKIRERLALKSLDEVGLIEFADRKPMEVSGGERRRVSLARCLVGQPQILFLDEPTSNLDSRTAMKIFDLLQAINKGGTTIFLSTHDYFNGSQLGNIFFIRDGKVTARA